MYFWYNNIVVNNKVKICTLTELRHHDHFRSPTMTYLGHRVLIQSQQIYFLQTFIIFAFYTIFSHFQENCWYNDENFNLKTFVSVANALWTRDIRNCEKYDWIRAPYVRPITNRRSFHSFCVDFSVHFSNFSFLVTPPFLFIPFCCSVVCFKCTCLFLFTPWLGYA